jgi:L-fuconolactonase
MLIVDAQVHAWKDGEATGHHRRRLVTAEALLGEMQAAGVDRVLIVPPLWDPSGNAYALAAARAHPDRFAAMGLLQVGDNWLGEARPRLARWKADGLRGLRFLFNAPDRRKALDEGALEWVWPLAEREGIAVALLVPGVLGIAADLAARFPGLPIIVDHLGVPRGASGPAAFDHLPALMALARFPNVAVKAVGVGDYAPEGYPFGSLDEPLRRVFDAFGPRRLIWGSDLSRLHHSYRECVTHVTEEIRWLSDDDRAQIMGLNLCRIVGWDVAGAGRRPATARA